MAQNSNNPIRVYKRLIQFNSLPFSFGELDEQSYTSTFKGETQSYTNNAHGGYFPTLGEFGKLNTSEITATVSLSLKNIGCEEKIRFLRFVKRQLAKSGKLWATQNGVEIIWANARCTSINEVLTFPGETDSLKLGLTFELIDGYWVLASRTRTWLCEYCPERFEDFDPYYCWDINDLAGVCDPNGLSKCYPCLNNLYEPIKFDGCDWKPLCNYPLKQRYHMSDGTMIPSLTEIYGSRCPNNYAIDYNCEREKEYFCFDAPWGSKFRLKADENRNETIIQFCSRTDIPSDFLRIRLLGVFDNPYITVNDDTVWVGSTNNPVHVDGLLTVGYGTRVYMTNDRRDPERNTVNIESKTDRTNTPMFQLQPGMNTIRIGGNKRKSDAFAYIDPVEITY